MAIYAKTEKPVNGVSITVGIDLEKRELDIFYRVTLPSGRRIEFHGGVCDNCYYINEYSNNDILPRLRSMFYYAPNGNWTSYVQKQNGEQISKAAEKTSMEEFFELSEEDKEVAISERRNFLNLTLRYNNNGGI